jgi:hypothetical protein
MRVVWVGTTTALPVDEMPKADLLATPAEAADKRLPSRPFGTILVKSNFKPSCPCMDVNSFLRRLI